MFRSSRSLNDEELAEDEEEDDNEEEENAFDFDPSSLPSKKPRKRMVTMMILPGGQEVTVKCRLPWTWSWLQARIKLNSPPTTQAGAAQQMKKKEEKKLFDQYLSGLDSVFRYIVNTGAHSFKSLF